MWEVLVNPKTIRIVKGIIAVIVGWATGKPVGKKYSDHKEAKRRKKLDQEELLRQKKMHKRKKK